LVNTKTAIQDDPIEVVETIELDQIRDPAWLLRPIEQELVTELARSIENTGLLQPIVVRRSTRGYEVIFGNHRLEACKRLGLHQIKALVKTCSDDEAFLARVSENLLRNSYIDPIQEAQGYRMLVDKGWTINAIGCKVGKCDSYISERLGIIHRLSQELRDELSRGYLTPSHAEVLSRIRNPKLQKELAELVKRKKLSVKSLENMITHAPLPTQTTIKIISDEYYARIPETVADFLELHNNQQLFVSIRGKKLVLEKIQSVTRPKKISPE